MRDYGEIELTEFDYRSMILLISISLDNIMHKFFPGKITGTH